MKHVALLALALASGSASAFCPVPHLTGNTAYDNQAQQMYHMCLNQERAIQQQQNYQQQQQNYQQQQSFQRPAGQIDFGILNTNIPAQVGYPPRR